MRKIKIIFIIFSAFCFNVMLVDAASASLSVSSTKIEKGSKVTATVSIKSAASWNVTITSSGATNGCTQTFADASTDAKNTNKSFSVTCKSNNTGLIGFILSGDVTSADGKNVKVSGNKSVTVVTPREKSTNNKLKSLSVEDYEITPSFDKDVNEYSVIVPSTVEKINIKGSKDDSYSSVSGLGEKTIEEGTNTFEIVVTSETGVDNVYKLNVNVMDQNPIEVTVDGKKYTVVKIAKNLEKPELYEETTIKINDFDIPAFTNEISKYTLVGLKDEMGNIDLFIYDNGKYTHYNEFKSDRLTMIFLEMKDVPDYYEKTSLTISEQKIVAYKSTIDNSYLIYAKNLATGKDNYYTYDRTENTFQIFNLDKYNQSLKEEQTNKYILIGLCLLNLFMFILVILYFSKSRKLKKMLNLKKKND